MKYIPKMWLAMRNYVKIFIILITIFQVIVVIVTLERSKDEEYIPHHTSIEESNGTIGPSLNDNETFPKSRSRILSSDGILGKIRQLSDLKSLNHSPEVTSTINNSFVSVAPDILVQDVKSKQDTSTFAGTTGWTIYPENQTEYESLPMNIVSYLLKTFNIISNPKEQSTVTAIDSKKIPERITVNPISNDIQSKFSTLRSIWETTKDSLEKDEHFTFQEIFTDLDKYYNRLTTEYDINSTEQPTYEEETIFKPTHSTIAMTEDNFANDVDNEFEKSNAPSITPPEKTINKSKHQISLNNILSWFHKKRQDEITTSATERIQTTSEYDGLFRSSSEYDTVAMIRGAGYPVETYRVQTEDGYILTVYRIPPTVPAGRPARRRWLPVYLQHGLWSSSYHWFETRPQYSLPFILSDAGYDVWIGNSRGNVISREHVYLSTATNSSFWDFSFHEMGIYDLPATIELVLKVSKKPQIHYIGHSMGTTTFFVMASMRPDVASKVHFMLALAPIATVGPIHNFFRWMLLFERFILTREKPVAFLTQNGISLKTVLHYMQLYVTGKFAMFDYGKMANMDIYNSAVPPTYDLTRIELPIVLCYGTNDPFVRTEDLITLTSSLGNSLGMWPVPLTHFQLTGGKESKEYLYNYIPLHLH